MLCLFLVSPNSIFLVSREIIESSGEPRQYFINIYIYILLDCVEENIIQWKAINKEREREKERENASIN